MSDSVLFKDEFDHFFKWINLNVQNLTWEGRYQKEFDEFCELFFKDGTSIFEQMNKFELASYMLKSSPLYSWFHWIQERLLCYIFIYKEYSLENLSNEAQIPINTLASSIRNFFDEQFPLYEDEINQKFLLGNLLSENASLTINDLSFLNKESIRGSIDDEVMTHLEVTLYKDFERFLSYLKDKTIVSSIDIHEVKNKITFKKQIQFFQELVLLFLIGGVLIFGLKVGNKWYEEYLSKKITLYEPDYFGKDAPFTLLSKGNQEKDLKLSFKELEKLEALETKDVFNDNAPGLRFDTESEVVVTSVDSLPKDFDVVSLDQSQYEESKKGGYRSSVVGRKKAYRVMMTSVYPDALKNKLNDLLDFYGAEQVDTVEPGTKIPGGIYYNLYVPSAHLKEFLSKLNFVEETTILESSSTFGGPQDKNKVFIWVKTI